MNRKLTLYQFTISHYCEKARWALDHKGLAYDVVNLLPGMHVKRTKKLAALSSVPVLAHGEQIIQGSAEIISYHDRGIVSLGAKSNNHFYNVNRLTKKRGEQ